MNEFTDADSGLRGQFQYIWGKRYCILGVTVLAAILGVVYALLAKPVWMAGTTISPKQTQGGGGPSLLSGLGGLGGAVASQFGTGGAGVERLEVMLKSRDLAERVILDNDLLPRLFPEAWDSTAGRWKPNLGKKKPSLKMGVATLQSSINVNTNVKSQLVYLTMFASNAKLSRDLVLYTLEALNARIKDLVEKDATANMNYLNSQLASAVDPLVREKIQQLVALEIEKSMLMQSRSFDVLESAYVPENRLRPKRKNIVVLYTVLGFFLSVIYLAFYKGVRDSMRAQKNAPEPRA